MRNSKKSVLGLAGILLFAASGALAGEDLVIESRFFRALSAGNAAPAAPAVIVTSFSDPVFLPAPRASYAAEANLTYVSAMRAELTGVYRLNQVDYLTSGRLVWDGKKDVLNEAIVLDGMLYAISYFPQKREGAKLALRVEVWRHQGVPKLSQYRETWNGWQRIISLTESAKIESAWGVGEKILNSEIATRLDDSIVFGFPVNGHAFFLSVKVTRQDGDDLRDKPIKVTPEDTASMTADSYVPPKPRVQVTPLYPENCKLKGIEGLVTLFVQTDESGKVKSVRVWQKADPDLDRSALEALRQWTFSPFLEKDKPSASSFFMSVDFKLPVSGTSAGSAESKKDKSGAARDDAKRK
jgi:TonB family protein